MNDNLYHELLQAGKFNELISIYKSPEKNIESMVLKRVVGVSLILTGDNYGFELLGNCIKNNDRDSQIWTNVLTDVGLKKIPTTFSEIKYQFNYQQQKSFYMEFPREIHIETWAYCNASCNFCPYPTMERKGDKMSDYLLEKIIGELESFPKSLPLLIAPFKVNDPLLDKRIYDLCHEINKRIPQASIRLFTNGTPLTAASIASIGEIRNLEHLWISLNETNESKYELTMGLPFYKTIEKLQLLHSIKSSGYPHEIVISRVADGSNEDVEFHNFLSKEFPLFKPHLIGRSDWTGQVASVQKNVPNTACNRWFEISIMASGKVALCCMDGEGKYVIGDVNSSSIYEIYNNPDFKKMRQFSSSRKGASAPCDTCTY